MKNLKPTLTLERFAGSRGNIWRQTQQLMDAKLPNMYGDRRGRRGSCFQSDSWDVSLGNEWFIVSFSLDVK